LRGKFHPEILRVPPERVRQTREEWEKSHFLDLSINMSKTVADAAKVTINDLAQG